MSHSTAICTLSMIPMRGEPRHRSEMVSMLLFGEVFTVEQSIDNWHQVSSRHDHYKGWIYSRMLRLVSEDFMVKYDRENPAYCGEFLATVHSKQSKYYMGFGSRLPLLESKRFYLGDEEIEYNHKAILTDAEPDGALILKMAENYLHTPYLWGGRSLLGIDCSGFTQMVFALCGIELPRDAWQQAETGAMVASLQEARAGDLVFFSENGQRVTHVGILTGDGHLIHASDDVRTDRIDENGIFNKDLGAYTLKASLIRRILVK